ncbi:LysR substrate-binding domain-containing protein [Undibacterium umbellatum]|uniref:LysR family transcriptional regulator n=1 Tax=Undibacterium umbellatum TaxID=2762300 RepID=A0ABR6ZG81_9BURK|nr:LysR substrate-binding domain-containing protein [Undibacterium umbellatum]MBC3910689.1 LysR family transcriptional regulator [Undibacterium umbellatum]
MKEPLRNLSLLVDFECAARWCSFKLAARELHKTPAAISQNIKQLEEQLGFALFERHARHLSITEKGSELATTVSQLLGDLHIKVAALREDSANDSLRISCTHSFAMKWLVPRLHRYTQLHPEIDIRIDSNDTVVNPAQGQCDIAIRHQQFVEGDTSNLLWREQLLLAYSPALLDEKDKRSPQAPRLQRLLRYPLLYEGTPEHWIRLLQDHGMLGQPHDFAQNYSHAGLLVQAAVAAQGVALLPAAIACEDLQQGRLQRLADAQLRSRYCYRIVTANTRSEKLNSFINWLHAEMVDMQNYLQAG